MVRMGPDGRQMQAWRMRVKREEAGRQSSEALHAARKALREGSSQAPSGWEGVELLQATNNDPWEQRCIKEYNALITSKKRASQLASSSSGKLGAATAGAVQPALPEVRAPAGVPKDEGDPWETLGPIHAWNNNYWEQRCVKEHNAVLTWKKRWAVPLTSSSKLDSITTMAGQHEHALKQQPEVPKTPSTRSRSTPSLVSNAGSPASSNQRPHTVESPMMSAICSPQKSMTEGSATRGPRSVARARPASTPAPNPNGVQLPSAWTKELPMPLSPIQLQRSPDSFEHLRAVQVRWWSGHARSPDAPRWTCVG